MLKTIVATALALLVCGQSLAQSYAVNAVARFDMYVSSVSYGGIPVGSDTADCGGRSNPCLTLDKALTRVLFNSRIYLNGDQASPTVYTTATNLVTGTYSVLAVNDYGAIVAGDGVTQALTIPVDGHITLGKIIVDPSQNSGGPAATCITIATNLNPYTRMDLTLVGTKFQNWTGQCVTGATIRATIASTGAIFNGGTVNGAYFLNSIAAGSFSSTGDSCTLTAQNLPGTGGCIVVIGATATTATVSITNPAFACTLSSGLAGIGLHYCVRLHDVVGTVSGGSSAILGAPGSRTGAGVYLSHATNNISNSSISAVTVTNTTNGGYGCAAGNESVTAAPLSSGITIEECQVTGNATSGAGALHCIFLGANLQNSAANDNVGTTCGISFVNKLGAQNSFTGNTAIGWYSSAMLMKGADTPTAANNNLNQTIATASTIGISMADDTPGSGTHTTDATVTGNTVTNTAGTSFVYFSVGADNTFGASNPANDNYINAGGTDAGNSFQIAGANYTSCPNYRTAVEPSATCTP